MYVLELHEALFESQQLVAPPSALRGWRIFAACDEDEWETCAINCSVENWPERELSDYVALMVSLCRKAASGLPLEELFNTKKLHEVGDVEVTRKGRNKPASIKLWQLRKQDVRILFFYGDGNHIVIAAHAFLKRGDKVPPAAITAGQVAAQAYFDELDAANIQTVTLQGENHEFSKAHQRPR